MRRSVTHFQGFSTLIPFVMQDLLVACIEQPTLEVLHCMMLLAWYEARNGRLDSVSFFHVSIDRLRSIMLGFRQLCDVGSFSTGVMFTGLIIFPDLDQDSEGPWIGGPIAAAQFL